MRQLLLFSFIISIVLMGNLYAGSPLGVGTTELMLIKPDSAFGDLMIWVNNSQREFYESISEALHKMREDGTGLWFLVFISFIYGIFHAAGPGHGKIVISSYMLANETSFRKGLSLSFISAALQAVSAITITSLGFFILHHTSISMTNASRFFEISSYVMLCSVGAWLSWKKISTTLRFFLKSANTTQPKDTEQKNTCCMNPPLLSRMENNETSKSLKWKERWIAIASVGLRPCSGALIVLSFAFLNKLWLGGIISVFAMSLGVAMTVSFLSILAMAGKNWLTKKSGGRGIREGVYRIIEMVSALLILFLGITLLAANLTG